MKVMFYGGCHALVLQQVFSRFGDGDHSYTLLRNYDLIQKGIPFPYDQASEQDVIVFSPVRRADYATQTLLDHCTARGIKTVSYPWMQWQALYPFSHKGDFLGGTSWHYRRLVEHFSPGTAADLLSGIEEPWFERIILENFDKATGQLRAFEDTYATDIRISDFVLEQYKAQRLFLTPDHPTQALYRYLVSEVSECIAIPVSADYFHSGVEPQEGVKMPIIPRVAEVLGLSYRDGDFENHLALGDKVLHWGEFMNIHMEDTPQIFQSAATTMMKKAPVASDLLRDADKIACPKGTILVVRSITPEGGHIRVSPIIVDAGTCRHTALSDDWYIYGGHWKPTRPGLL